MTIDIRIPGFEAQLEGLEARFDAVDEEELTRETARRIANEAAEMVRTAVIAEDDIITPAMNSPYDRGPGPSMANPNAWVVKPSGKNRFIMSPHELVEQRAYVLNYGYPGKITPNTADYLRFYVEGEPVFRKEVEGPDPTGYWEAAFRRLESSNKPKQIMEDVLDEELDEAGL